MSFVLPPLIQAEDQPFTAEPLSASTPGVPGVLNARTRGEKLAEIRRSHWARVGRDRVGMIPLPRGFTVPTVVHHLQSLGRQKSEQDLRDKIDEVELDLLESRTSRKGKGIERFGASLEALARKSDLLGRQRNRGYLFVFTALLDGDLPAHVAAAITQSYYWEGIGRALLTQELIPQARDAADKAGTPKSLAIVERSFWDQWGAVSALQDVVLNQRERLCLLLDCWNSSSVGQVYLAKPWKVAKLPSTWETHLEQVEKTSGLLSDVIASTVPPARLSEAFRLAPELEPMAKDLFQALIGADAE